MPLILEQRDAPFHGLKPWTSNIKNWDLPFILKDLVSRHTLKTDDRGHYHTLDPKQNNTGPKAEKVTMMKKVQVVPYDPHWPHIFQTEAHCIQKALSDNRIAIHHVGSTSVSGLAAKPKIDIIAVVKNGEKAIAPLQRAGYTHRGEYNIPFKEALTKRGQNDFNLHVFEQNNPEIELNILFRDHLRKHPSARDQYAQLKAELLADESNHEKNGAMFVGYTLGKDSFIRSILHDAGYIRRRFLRPTHHQEWADYHRIRQTSLPLGVVYDTNHPSVTSCTAQHFILCDGITTRSIGHIDILGQSVAVLRAVATDRGFQNQGYGSEMLTLMEKWLKKQGIVCLHTHSLLDAQWFYKKRGFVDFSPDFPGTTASGTARDWPSNMSPCTPTDMGVQKPSDMILGTPERGVDWSVRRTPPFSAPHIHLVKML